ncbi:glycosyl hydrolase [Catellatospora sp. NPDC049609]|uniref:glycosyl hydrolase n=1 Tax=Catellatospora sp. NPDC049609 TaxID=3155505 RepID=UPI0034367EF3
MSLRRPIVAAIGATALALTAGTLVALTAGTTAVAAAATCNALFDDFSYSGPSDPLISQRGWTVRTYSGGPGIPGASWPTTNVSFPTVDGAKSLQLQASTDGTAGGTSQAELYHQQKFFEGTYASRVKFTDAPVSGNDGDHLVETFFTITPLAAPMDPNYGEIDFEYLPNGGWGEPSNIMYETTWETYRPDPWEAVNAHGEQRQSYAGWHDLVFTVSAGHVKYYIDGNLVADHSGIYCPETNMSINFNLWFIDAAAHTGGMSTYRQQVDYVLYSQHEVLTPAQVNARVGSYRAQNVAHTDTVGTGGGTCPTASPSTGPSTPPSSSPSASPRPPSPSPSAPPTGGTGCANAATWTVNGVYTTGNQVKWERSANGNPSGPKSGDGVHLWRAKWWTQGSEPGWTVQWEDLGRC